MTGKSAIVWIVSRPPARRRGYCTCALTALRRRRDDLFPATEYLVGSDHPAVHSTSVVCKLSRECVHRRRVPIPAAATAVHVASFAPGRSRPSMAFPSGVRLVSLATMRKFDRLPHGPPLQHHQHRFKRRLRTNVTLMAMSLLSLLGAYTLATSVLGFHTPLRISSRFSTATGPQSQLTQGATSCVLPQVYDDDPPRLTAIIQSYDHVMNVANISASLISSTGVGEIVVCEDGSTDGSHEAWTKALRGLRHFVVRSNNLHEMRAYNRAMRLADGAIILLLQDDDLLPPDDLWIQNALMFMERYPDLGILGGYIGQLWDHDTKKGFEYGEQTSTHGGTRKGPTQPIPYTDPQSGLPFMFVECAWNAPLFVRREFIRTSGGLNLDIAKRGEPGVWQDCVYCYEAWDKGFSVAVFDAPFVRGVGGHGSAATSEKVKLREAVHKRALGITEQLYDRRATHNRVLERNRKSLRTRNLATDYKR